MKEKGTALRNLLESVSSRLRPFFGGSLLIFLVTGTHLMLINKNYLGLGNFFGNPLKPFRLALNINMFLGLFILLLTSIAQAVNG